MFLESAVTALVALTSLTGIAAPSAANPSVAHAPASVVLGQPLVSDNWTKLFTWQGVGPMPEAEGAKLQAYVAGAHAQGYRVSFWATPDEPSPEREAVRNELFDAGVDHINTDDLEALEQFLTARML